MVKQNLPLFFARRQSRRNACAVRPQEQWILPITICYSSVRLGQSSTAEKNLSLPPLQLVCRCNSRNCHTDGADAYIRRTAGISSAPARPFSTRCCVSCRDEPWNVFSSEPPCQHLLKKIVNQDSLCFFCQQGCEHRQTRVDLLLVTATESVIEILAAMLT